MDIIVPHRIRKRELDGKISDEARKLFAKLKDRPEIAVGISARGLPASTTLHKVYATTEGGPRRLLFFCRHVPARGTPTDEQWVLLFYRDKADDVGRNLEPRIRRRNPWDFVNQAVHGIAMVCEYQVLLLGEFFGHRGALRTVKNGIFGVNVHRTVQRVGFYRSGSHGHHARQNGET